MSNLFFQILKHKENLSQISQIDCDHCMVTLWEETEKQNILWQRERLMNQKHKEDSMTRLLLFLNDCNVFLATVCKVPMYDNIYEPDVLNVICFSIALSN